MSSFIPLTPSQRDTLEYIRSYFAEHKISPTYREMGDNFGITASAAFSRCVGLERRGLIRRTRDGGRMMARNLEVIDRGTAGDHSVHVVATIETNEVSIKAQEVVELLELGWASSAGVRAVRIVGDGFRQRHALVDGDVVIISTRPPSCEQPALWRVGNRAVLSSSEPCPP